jgi:hypothetical protein
MQTARRNRRAVCVDEVVDRPLSYTETGRCARSNPSSTYHSFSGPIAPLADVLLKHRSCHIVQIGKLLALKDLQHCVGVRKTTEIVKFLDNFGRSLSTDVI